MKGKIKESVSAYSVPYDTVPAIITGGVTFRGSKVESVIFCNNSGHQQSMRLAVDNSGEVILDTDKYGVSIQYMDGSDPLSNPFNRNKSPVRLIITLG
jgi:hypothetical protein